MTNNLKAERTLTAEELQVIIAAMAGEKAKLYVHRLRPEFILSMASMALQSLSTQQPMGEVRVRPLMWSDTSEETLSRFQVASVAHVGLCNFSYEIYRNTNGTYEPVFPGSLGGAFEAIEDAKAAAQADYETRILSALHPNQESGE